MSLWDYGKCRLLLKVVPPAFTSSVKWWEEKTEVSVCVCVCVCFCVNMSSPQCRSVCMFVLAWVCVCVCVCVCLSRMSVSWLARLLSSLLPPPFFFPSFLFSHTCNTQIQKHTPGCCGAGNRRRGGLSRPLKFSNNTFLLSRQSEKQVVSQEKKLQSAEYMLKKLKLNVSVGCFICFCLVTTLCSRSA